MTTPGNSKGGDTAFSADQQLYPEDPFGGIKEGVQDPSPLPQVVGAFHKRSDVDSKTVAQHHTLGPGHNQASPGDHKHDGTSSKKLMDGITIGGAKGGNTALADLLLKLAPVLGFTDSSGP